MPLGDVLTAAPAKVMSATLDRDDPPPTSGQARPPLWHWLYFLPAFEFRAMSPLSDTEPFSVCGRFDDRKHASLCARGPQGPLAMQASATLA